MIGKVTVALEMANGGNLIIKSCQPVSVTSRNEAHFRRRYRKLKYAHYLVLYAARKYQRSSAKYFAAAARER